MVQRLGQKADLLAGIKARQNIGAGAGGAAAGGAAAGGAAAGGAAAGGGPTVQQPAMTDQSGNVVSFDAANVYLAGVDAGL